MPRPTAIAPTKNDAVFGRGGGSNKCRKNTCFRDLIEHHWIPYSSIAHHQTRAKKAYVKEFVIRPISEMGGRFLKFESSGCYELLPACPTDLKAIYQKISQSMRDEKKKHCATQLTNMTTKKSTKSSTKKAEKRVKRVRCSNDDSSVSTASTTSSSDSFSSEEEPSIIDYSHSPSVADAWMDIRLAPNGAFKDDEFVETSMGEDEMMALLNYESSFQGSTTEPFWLGATDETAM
ncbi:expressed unknown protein [Seminavis robusta]|uniref:DUF6824 domain-containing protein n=1 Tax=Seminavis robusta TaxID=568900 RepID=A0A9N8EIF8_9STRA|nr:expressed unknown protein [Seminavis robusta]|eukprot:Sro1051_g235660.1 n/a (234) ;mRNA; f:9160-9861